MPLQTRSGKAGAGCPGDCHDVARHGNSSAADGGRSADGDGDPAHGDTVAYGDLGAAYCDANPGTDRDTPADADRLADGHGHANAHGDTRRCQREDGRRHP